MVAGSSANKGISYPIDLYQVHQPWSFSGEKIEMEVMAELFNRKLIKAVGVSNFNAQKMENSWKTLQKSGIPLATTANFQAIIGTGAGKIFLILYVFMLNL